MAKHALLFSLSYIASLVTAHGFVQNASIGGREYDFYHPYQDMYMNPAPLRISRRIVGNGPVENVSSIDLECGGWTAGNQSGSVPAPLHADAKAGSEVTLRWTLWPDSHEGPVMTYMARCPDDGCQSYTPSAQPSPANRAWFKIAHSGRIANTPNFNGNWSSDFWLYNTWGDTETMKYPNEGLKYTIPKCLKPGYYLVRHEILALHSAYKEGGAQFYPGCHQLKITGSGTTLPPASTLVGFPGAYDSKDPGVLYNMYNMDDPKSYKIPGPEVWTC